MELLGRIFQVVHYPVQGGLACSKDVGEIFIGDGAVFSSDRINQPDKLMVVPHWVDTFPTADLERFFLSDGLPDPSNELRAASEPLFQLGDRHFAVSIPRQEEVERKDVFKAVDILEQFMTQTCPVNLVEFFIGGFFHERGEVEKWGVFIVFH